MKTQTSKSISQIRKVNSRMNAIAIALGFLVYWSAGSSMAIESESLPQMTSFDPVAAEHFHDFRDQVIPQSSNQKRVLIVGDSHIVGDFGTTLGLQFRKAGWRVWRVGIVGSVPSDLFTYRKSNLGAVFEIDGEKRLWSKPYRFPSLENLLADARPDRVVFEFGDNMAAYSSNLSKTALGNLKAQIEHQTSALVNALKSQAPGLQCYWITPYFGPEKATKPYFKSDDRLVDLVEAITRGNHEQCKLIVSHRDLGLIRSSIRTSSDGLHFTSESGKTWANAAFNAIKD